MRVERIATVLFAAALFGVGVTGCDGETGGNGGGGGSGGGTTTGTTTGTMTGTTVGTTSTTTTTTVVQPSNFLGLSCTADAQCGPMGKCIQTTDNDPFLGGGPAGGYCTKPCEADSECGIGNVCFYDAPSGVGECILGCIFGEPELMFLNDELDPSKCHGREDVRCAQLQDGSEVCLPTCGSDSQCDGRVCDPRIAVCVDTPNAGKALGEQCDPEAMEPECAGTCITIGSGDPTMDKYMCTSPCVMAGLVEGSDDCGGLEKGICIYSPSGTGVGDTAFCAESCTAQEDCQYPNFFCNNINVQTTGVCLDAEPCTSDAQCTFTDAECIETTLGKFCMSPTYPLGGLTPTGMGGAGGTGGAGGAGGGMGGAGGTGGAGGAGGGMGGTGGM